MKTALKEAFNALSLPVMIMAEWAQESPIVKQVCNQPFEAIARIFNTSYDPNFIANHMGTASGAYLFATLMKYQFGLQDKVYDKKPFRKSLADNRHSIKAAFASVACVTLMETIQMLNRNASFDWADFNTCMVTL